LKTFSPPYLEFFFAFVTVRQVREVETNRLPLVCSESTSLQENFIVGQNLQGQIITFGSKKEKSLVRGVRL
jgi:hypothetical protein